MHCSNNLTLNLMQACNAHGLYCVPLYDTLGIQFSLQFHYITMHSVPLYLLSFDNFLDMLGANAVEFVMCHAEVTIVFVEEKKIPEV